MKVNYDRKLVPDYQQYFDPEGKLIDMLVEIKKLIKEYGPEAYIEGRTDPYSNTDRLSYAVYIKSPETDNEYSDRLAKEEKWARESDESEAAEYKRLQEKFGTKV